jgi:uncharacterized protein (TIGR02145 family)
MSSPGNITGTVTQAGSGTITVTGLTNGTAYTFTVTATNSAGTGAASATSNSVTPVAAAPSVTTVTSSTGKIWMDRNLGATQAANSSTDAASYGDLYQWGRGTDGHQSRTSATTATLSSSDTPGNGDFITTVPSPYDWRSTPNDNLWQGVNGVNNPCPSGYRLPTEAEWIAETDTWGNNKNVAGAFASPLKLSNTGFRQNNGQPSNVGVEGIYWSSTVDGTVSRALYYGSGYLFMTDFARGRGSAIRCIQDGGSTLPPATAPGAPTIGTATAGDAEATVAFTAPASDGGAAITTYTATSSPGNITGMVTQAGSGTITVTGLTNGTAYTFTVTATNSAGTGAASAASNSVTPVAAAPSSTDVTSLTGRVWMDRNLGATQVATSSSDAASYGDLYQWGRGTDGHQSRTSGKTITTSSSNTPGNSDFITSSGDWRSPGNDDLWQGISGWNNPCPTGYLLPTEAEWEAERVSWSSSNAAGAFGSQLKLPVAGVRYNIDGSLVDVGTGGDYWSSTVSGTSASYLYFDSSDAAIYGGKRALGLSVRCIKKKVFTSEDEG